MHERDDFKDVTFAGFEDQVEDLDMEVEELTEDEYRAISESYPGRVGGRRS